MSGFLHPAFWALVAGLVIAVRGLFGLGPWWVEPILWSAAFAAFAVWAGLWIRHRVFGPTIWLGLLISVWTPITQGLFFGTYAANNPDFAAGASGWWMFSTGIAIAVVYCILLGLAASGVARVARRRARPSAA